MQTLSTYFLVFCSSVLALKAVSLLRNRARIQKPSVRFLYAAVTMCGVSFFTAITLGILTAAHSIEPSVHMMGYMLGWSTGFGAVLFICAVETYESPYWSHFWFMLGLAILSVFYVAILVCSFLHLHEMDDILSVN